MRRLLAGSAAFLGLAGLVVILPVYGSSGPAPEPVKTFSREIALGSFAQPAVEATVRDRPSDPVDGVPAQTPTLGVQRTDVSEFSLVGVTWAQDPLVTDVVVNVRVQDAEGDWGSWTEVGTELSDQEPGADTGAEVRGGTAPLWTGPSTGVDVELVTRSGAQPTDVQLDLVDPGSSPADAEPGDPDIQDVADAALSMPAVHSRAQWGADESLTTWGPQYAPTIKAATLHHTADSNNYAAGDVPAILRSIYRYHAVSLGWGDIGYHVIADKFGRLWEGRSGGLASTVIGAHAGGFNTSTFGVSMLGNYDTVATTPAMIQAVASIIAWKFQLYGIDPRGTTSLTSAGGGTAKYAAGTRVTVPTIFGHRDVGSTACPGRYGYAELGNIRAIAASMANSFVSPIDEFYDGNAAVRSQLGAPVGGQGGTADGQGLFRTYQQGVIYWSAATGAHAVSGAVRTYWAGLGAESSWLRYPVGEMVCGLAGGGCRQEFQNGTVTWSPATGAQGTNGGIRAAWLASGGESGAMGYPTTALGCGFVRGGCGQQFQRGSIYWSPTAGAHPTSGAIRATWMATGWERGPLGYASSDITCGLTDDGCIQTFEGGLVLWAPAVGSRWTNGPIAAAWVASGRESGPLGYPTTDMACGLVRDGCGQTFEDGVVQWSAATGAHAVSGPIYAHWKAKGAEGGPMGYASSAMTCSTDGTRCRQNFQGETVLWEQGSGVVSTSGAIRTLWLNSGGESSWLGEPKADMVCVPEGCRQEFQGGTVTWTATTGTRATNGAVRSAWVASGREAGPLGFPSSDLGCGMVRDGCGQQFQGGSVYWSPATGAHPVTGGIWDHWTSRGWERGSLGYAVADMVCGAGAVGCRQDFQTETVTWSAATGGQSTSGGIRTLWLREGGQSGVLGVPSAPMRCGLAQNGCAQAFAGGEITWTPATGAVATTGPIAQRWATEGREGGYLRY
ncbi:MAG TPA: N-acetylmuramoyl-L-alanine amidase, partial [Blastococcus sp.]|nr:N-acetylmuramoyl-L-alanine amidase [Blastococcus sp.]